MKETEEEQLIRIKNEVAETKIFPWPNTYFGWDVMIKLIHDSPDHICERYELVIKKLKEERMKSILPSEEEMIKNANLYFEVQKKISGNDKDASNREIGFVAGFMSCLQLLTKGDR